MINAEFYGIMPLTLVNQVDCVITAQICAPKRRQDPQSEQNISWNHLIYSHKPEKILSAKCEMNEMFFGVS